MIQGVLSGIRVLDATHVLSGPTCTLLLADAGAEVIKIERPSGGDPTRGMGPYGYGPDGQRAGGYFMRINRGKKSVCLNLKHPRGQQIFKDLAVVSDVVIENFAPGTMAQFGLDYAAIKAVKPDIIYASISGFGNADAYPGPYDDRPALNEIAQAMGGIMDLTGHKGGPPTDVAVPLGDIFPGVVTAFGIAAALLHRQATGQGKRLDVSMYDSMVFLNERSILQYSLTGKIPTRGKAGTMSFGGVFPTRDGHIAVRVMGEGMWKALCRTIERPDLLSDPRFATDVDRMEHTEPLREIFEGWLARHGKYEAADLLAAAGIAAGAVQDARDVYDHPITRGRGMLEEVEDPIVGVVTTAASPVKYADEPPPGRKKLPRLGEHTQEVLTSLLGLSEADVSDLVRQGAIA